MKREIKFRAYSSHNHKMYPVSNIEWDIDGRIWVTADDGKNGIELIDEEANLMQYTGLRDKNGREIYEGDIVKVIYQYWGKLGNRYEVKFKQGAFYVKYSLLSETSPSTSVIGNVHENPELLEAEK